MNKTFAVVVAGAMPVVRTYPENVPAERVEHVTLNVPNGWDDVKPLTNKVIEFAGNKFVFTGWNSDTNHIYFKRAGLTAHIL